MRLSISISLKKIVLGLATGLNLSLLHVNAYALEGDVIRPYASATYMYDDNLRRFSSTQQTLVSTGSRNMADTMLMTEVGIIFDKQISQQKFYVDLSVNKSRFDRNSMLDSSGRDLNAKWNWHIGNKLQGNFEASHKKSMVPFSDFRAVNGFGLNLKNQDRYMADAIWRFHPRWQTRVAFVNYKVDYSAESQRTANLDENSQELGLDYLAPSGSKVGLLYRHADGSRPVDQIFRGVPINNDYDQDEFKLNADWNITGKSRLQFLGGLVRRTHAEFSNRDFEGFNARGTYTLAPTGKTNFSLSFYRENNAQSFVTSSYTLNRGVALKAAWLAREKVTIQSSIGVEKRDFVADEAFGQGRSDKDHNYTLSLIYKPTLSFLVNAALTHSTRDSSVELFEYKSNSISLTGQYEF